MSYLSDELANVVRLDRMTEVALDLDQERRDRRDEKAETAPGTCRCGCGEKTPLATQNRRGYRAGEPTNFVPGHQRRKSAAEYVIDPRTGCWDWQRARNNFGYGQTTVDGKLVYAHRHYYEQHNGRIEPGHVIDHTCANPSCVNPAHLEAVTSGENIRRGSRGRGSVRARADERRAAAALFPRTGNVTPAPIDPPDIAA